MFAQVLENDTPNEANERRDSPINLSIEKLIDHV
jgi:hypothetical protein